MDKNKNIQEDQNAETLSSSASDDDGEYLWDESEITPEDLYTAISCPPPLDDDFEFLCELFANKQPLPGGVFGPYSEVSTEFILNRLVDRQEPMTDVACVRLGLPLGSTHAEGVNTIMGGPNFTEEDLRRAEADVGFDSLVKAYATRTLPEDEGNWDLVGPPNIGLSIAAILDVLQDCREALPKTGAFLLGLPTDSTYADAVNVIRENPSHRYVPEAHPEDSRAQGAWKHLGF